MLTVVHYSDFKKFIFKSIFRWSWYIVSVASQILSQILSQIPYQNLSRCVVPKSSNSFPKYKKFQLLSKIFDGLSLIFLAELLCVCVEILPFLSDQK